MAASEPLDSRNSQLQVAQLLKAARSTLVQIAERNRQHSNKFSAHREFITTLAVHFIAGGLPH